MVYLENKNNRHNISTEIPHTRSAVGGVGHLKVAMTSPVDQRIIQTSTSCQAKSRKNHKIFIKRKKERTAQWCEAWKVQNSSQNLKIVVHRQNLIPQIPNQLKKCKEKWIQISPRWCERTDKVAQTMTTSSYCCDKGSYKRRNHGGGPYYPQDFLFPLFLLNK